jgi:hypothetical protein
VHSRAGLDDMEKTPPGLVLLPLGHPARNQSLYRLSYPASLRPRKEQFKVVSLPWKPQAHLLQESNNSYAIRIHEFCSMIR